MRGIWRVPENLTMLLIDVANQTPDFYGLKLLVTIHHISALEAGTCV